MFDQNLFLSVGKRTSRFFLLISQATFVLACKMFSSFHCNIGFDVFVSSNSCLVMSQVLCTCNSVKCCTLLKTGIMKSLLILQSIFLGSQMVSMFSFKSQFFSVLFDGKCYYYSISFVALNISQETNIYIEQYLTQLTLFITNLQPY